ncbi:MAG: hypothetical protein GY729_17240 [Desulfobacteraceae bacterium]|nr:hypothetical protein [Desulfobacteraceae bacterium]
MKIERKHKLGFFDVDVDFRLKVEACGRILQEAAVFHSAKVGVGPDVLYPKGVIWLLNRLEMEFYQYPLLDEDLKVTTWSSGFNRHQGFREYQITCPGQTLVNAASVWIFYDFKQKKIARIPKQYFDLYKSEDESNFEEPVNTWRPCGRISMDETMDITLRYADVDTNGHVNNTVYLGFVETLFHRMLKGSESRIRNLKIRFGREIKKTQKQIRIGWKKKDDRYQFNVFDGDLLFADGEVTVLG